MKRRIINFNMSSVGDDGFAVVALSDDGRLYKLSAGTRDGVLSWTTFPELPQDGYEDGGMIGQMMAQMVPAMQNAMGIGKPPLDYEVVRGGLECRFGDCEYVGVDIADLSTHVSKAHLGTT